MTNPNLDCTGLPCPQPVLHCKHCIDEHQPDDLTVVVDNEAALQNVTRFLQTQGYQVEDVQAGQGQWRIKAVKLAEPAGQTAQTPDPTGPAAHPSKALIFLTTPGIGEGDPALGEKLMFNFLATLPEMGPQLWRMILVNGAVHLAVQGSPCLEPLQKLEAAGVAILVCGTCLTHFGLMDKRAVGQTTNMLDVVTSLQLADKVIRP